MKKPSYRTSKVQLWVSFWFAWSIIVGIVWSGLEGSENAVVLANIVIPSMILLIAAMLGIHRFAGAMDFANAQRAESVLPSSPPYNPRDVPAEFPENSR
ncbi:NAD(P)+ transhydrogenase beta chain [Rhizobium pusense]|uniref:NAD(P)+ transhydrogenase beta chain n=1 Tax=Agrobacterium pusense TaxID=648995 RepID=UPI00244982EB|nr:NAD(P)+ transhydrogenase beta chain [Agrobacterium pusense]MDH1097430.1 NAD(P)+ transhydrogenase beta chain [Agrobacterium pusense]MDH1111260.1 NAD(P)+ transhydrogenase beta chain [Agrobacterium pusense]MDH2193463.1 NAD(P)+ transhydrogenase beta chain [Agrobacterium pusense]